jgi:hypothetical protein
MKTHKKTIRKVAESKGQFRFERTTSDRDPRNHLSMTQQEQDNVTQPPHASGVSPNPADQMGQAILKRRQTEIWASPDYQMQLMLLGQQNKKRLLMARQERENITHAPPVPGTSSNSANQMELGTSKRRQKELSRTPMPASAPHDRPSDDYTSQLRLIEQQNKKHLLMARQELDNAK